jgi:hypothetical protein
MFSIPDDVNPQAYILWLLRDGRAHDWEGLARAFGLDPSYPGTASGILMNYLYALQHVELITMENRPDFRWAQYYRPDLAAALNDKDLFEVEFIHVAGHQGGPDALMTTEEMGAHAYEPDVLTAVMHGVAGVTQCAILSACFSEEQAAAIATEIPYVIGIHADIGNATRTFAADFYRSVSAGRPVEEAHEIASNRLRLEGVPAARLPKLIGKSR